MHNQTKRMTTQSTQFHLPPQELQQMQQYQLMQQMQHMNPFTYQPIQSIQPIQSTNAKNSQKNKKKKQKKQLKEQENKLGEWSLPLDQNYRLKQEKQKQEEQEQQKRKQEMAQMSKTQKKKIQFEELGLIDIQAEIEKCKAQQNKGTTDTGHHHKKYKAMDAQDINQVPVAKTRKRTKTRKIIEKHRQFKEQLKEKKREKEERARANASFITIEGPEEKIDEELDFAELNNLGLMAEHKSLERGVYKGQVPPSYQGQIITSFIDHTLDEQLDRMVMQLVNQLKVNQLRKKLTKPLKYKKRIVAGFNESRRTLLLSEPQKRSKCVVVAANVKHNPFKQGQSHQLGQIIDMARQQGVPVVYSNTRSRLGLAFTSNANVRVSVLSIVNYEGFQESMGEILSRTEALRKEYG